MAAATERYASLLEFTRLRERPLLPLPALPSELELQARWFAGDFGHHFHTVDGAPVTIVQFGAWNREPGPDFTDAVVQFGSGREERGAIELDLLDRSWERHGHATNPAFSDTILHLFFQRSEKDFFSRTTSHRQVPQVLLDLGALEQNESGIVALAHAGRCVAPLRDLAPERVQSVLEAAAQWRLQRKARRWRQRMTVRGEEQIIYESLADALGYKQNRLPFTLVAQRLPLAFLRERPADAEALLFGVAGFLRPADPKDLSSGARSYMRTLWDRWWKYRDLFAHLEVPATLWRMSGARPLNHPHRRLGALAALLQNWTIVYSSLVKSSQREGENALQGLRHDFWEQHYNLRAKAISRPQALIGPSRVTDWLANVWYPLAFEQDQARWDDYKKLHAPLTNRPVKIAAARLFATDPRQREFLRTVVGQQGLLQIYEDFCLRDASDCAVCPFPEQIQRW